MATTPESSPIQRVRRGPRYRIGAESPQMDSVSLHEFREHTKGLSGRLRMPSVEGMRAGTILSPHAHVRRYVIAARQAGLPKEWIQRFGVFVQRTIDSQYPMEATSLTDLQKRAMALEGAGNVAEKCHDLQQDLASAVTAMQTQQAEIAAELLVLAKLQRKVEEMEACK